MVGKKKKTSPFRTEIELLQPYGLHKGFTHTATTNNSEDVVIVTGMTECNKIALMVDSQDAFIEFDGDATSESLLIPAGQGYSDDGIIILTKITMKNAKKNKNARVRGMLWGR